MNNVDKAMTLALALRSAAYNSGYEDAHPSDAWTRQEKAVKKANEAIVTLRTHLEAMEADRVRLLEALKYCEESGLSAEACIKACDAIAQSEAQS